MPRLIIDGHADTAQRFVDQGWRFTDPLGAGHLSLQTARQGGVGAAFFAAWVEPSQWKGRYAQRALSLINSVHGQARRHPDKLSLCVSPAEVRAANAEGRLAMLLSVEGGHSIENDLGLLHTFHGLGVRSMTLTWSNTNEWADSTGDLDDDAIRHHGGLTDFGREVVREMNRLGMMVDISHVSDATFDDVLATTQAPVIASHSSARALTRSPRNLTDEMLLGLAANGGVAMVNFFPAFIDEAWREAWNAQRGERAAAHGRLLRERVPPISFAITNAVDRDFAARIQRPPLERVVDHIEHMIRVAGVKHVGIGTDFDGVPALPEGIDSAADLPKVFDALNARGFSESDLDLVAGGNLLRVFDRVLDAAQSGGPDVRDNAPAGTTPRHANRV